MSALLLSLTATSAVAQMNTKPYRFGELNRDYKEVPQLPGESTKAAGIEIYSNNFDNPADWTIDNDGQAGGAFGWSIDGSSDGWWSGTGINSTSGGNFAELSNGDAQAGDQALGVVYSMTIAAPIDIPNLPANATNTDQVTLQYQEYGARFNDLQEVQISLDGTVWTTVRNNLDYSVLSAGGGAAYANPENISINLAPYITGNANTVWIRFTWTTNFPQFPTNPNVWITYGWYIDDIKIFTNADNDLESQEAYWGTEYLNYYQIPLTQAAPIDFTTNAFNNGIATQTGAVLNVAITGAETHNETSQLATIASGAYDSLILTNPITPATVGTYNVTWGISQDQTDDVPSNNTNPNITFAVTNFVYARDNNTPSGTNSNGGEGYEVGNLFDAWADQDVYSLNIRLSNTTEVGSILQGKIYYLDPNAADLETGLSEIGQTNFHTVAVQDLNTIIDLPLLFPTSLVSGDTYLVVIATDGDGGATDDVVVRSAGTSDPSTSFFYDATDLTWYYTTNTPMIRLDFEDNASLSENSAVGGLSAYPNPATDNLSIAYTTANSSDLTINIVDITGKSVDTIYPGVQEAGAHKMNINTSSYASGVYYIQVANGEQTSTIKFVKK